MEFSYETLQKCQFEEGQTKVFKWCIDKLQKLSSFWKNHVLIDESGERISSNGIFKRNRTISVINIADRLPENSPNSCAYLQSQKNSNKRPTKKELSSLKDEMLYFDEESS